jgi:hypothetical protein
VSTPSTDTGSSRDLRDRPLGRIALLVGVLVVALLFARSCGSNDGISSDRAIELARKEASFTPDRDQVRLVQRGIPPRASWAVSLYDVDPRGRPTKIEVFLVDRKTGTVTRG